MSLFCGEEGADGHWVDVDPADDAPLLSSALFVLLFPPDELMVNLRKEADNTNTLLLLTDAISKQSHVMKKIFLPVSDPTRNRHEIWRSDTKP